MQSIFKSVLMITLILLISQSCDKDATGIETDEGTGNLTILLTDAPANYDSVNITFAEVSAHHDSAWINILIDTVTINLLDWTNGNTMILGSNDVPAGKYTQIRLKIIDAEIGVNGQVFPLKVPSGAQSGLKFGPQFTINEGSSYELVIDFDASRSIVTTGPPHNPKGYKLKPRIRVIPSSITGSISGVVLDPFEDPIAFAILNGDTTTSTIIDTVTGSFTLAFLPEGMYKVSVVDSVVGSFSKDSIDVTSGENYDLGNISL